MAVTRKPSRKTDRQRKVIIVGFSTDEDEIFSWLGYFDGTLRCYYKDKYDPRCGKDLPYFDDVDAAEDYLCDNQEAHVQLDIEAALEDWSLMIDPEEIAEVAEFRKRVPTS